MGTATISTIDIVQGTTFEEHGYQYEAWDMLRAEDPVHWYERDYIDPFWAVTRHDDIQTVSRNPLIYGSTQGIALVEKVNQVSAAAQQDGPTMFIQMDPPNHAKYRRVVTSPFTPRALGRFMPRIEEMSTQILDDVVGRIVDEAADAGGEIDFVVDLAAKLPVYTICEMIGVPAEDGPLMFRWTNEQLGSSDPEYQGDRPQGELRQEAADAMNMYFFDLLQRRKKEPKNDIISMLIQGNIDGRELSDAEVIGNCQLLILAGNETTRNATSGGMLALIEHPEEQEKLRNHPEYAKSATEEILRWTSPLIHFSRVAMEDTELRGKQIKKGDTVALFYPSANRDPEVFDDPYKFDVTRDPNDHLAFGGYGEHFCLGANLARAELQAVYQEILSRMTDIEMTGEAKRLRSGFLGGIKHLPIKFKAIR